MKILQINKYHYIRGGSDSVYFNTSELLKDNGCEVVHFAMDYAENKYDENSDLFAVNEDFTQKNSIDKVRSLPSFFFNRDASAKLEELIKREKPDVAHLHIFYGSLTSSVLSILKKYKVPAVVSVHDYKFVCPSYLFLNGKNNICEQCKGNNYLYAVKNRCVKGSSLFSAVFAAESYYRDAFYPLNKMFKKLIFVSKFSEDIHTKYKPELRELSTHLYNFDPVLEHKIPEHRQGRYFLYAGRLSKEKGLETLVNAFPDDTDVYLKIAGTGDILDHLRDFAKANIEFLGFVKGGELQDIIKGASFVIVPSEWYENNPMAIIEAYSLGKPVIAADIGGIPEIVRHGKTGFLFKSGSKEDLKRQIDRARNLSVEEYGVMSRASVQFAQANFAPKDHFKRLMEIYEEVII